MRSKSVLRALLIPVLLGLLACQATLYAGGFGPAQGSGGSSGAAQTPWTGDVDAAGHSLTGVGAITAGTGDFVLSAGPGGYGMTVTASDGDAGSSGADVAVTAGAGNAGDGGTGGSITATGGASSGTGGVASVQGGNGNAGHAGGKAVLVGGGGNGVAGTPGKVECTAVSAAGAAGAVNITGVTTCSGNLSATNYPSAWTDVASVTDGWDNATTSLRWMRSGSSVRAVVLTTASGTPADASYTFQLDAGMPAPVTAGIGGSVAIIGRAVYYDASAGFYAGIVYWNGTDAFVYYHGGAALMTQLTSRVPATVANTDFVVCNLDYPCAP